MLHWSCAALALLVGCQALPGPSPDPEAATDRRQVHWQRTVEDAQALARATGRPILLALNMDGESASDRIWHENYRDPRFVALTRRCVCVGASVFRHNASDHDERGRRIPCPRFAGLTCGEHVALEPELFRLWFRDGERVAPRHALVRPDGSVAFDLSLAFDLTDIDRAIAAETDGLEPWCEPPAADWAALAARRDAAGRQELERAVLAIDDPATLDAALAALAAHGDAGALPALRLLAARLPDAPLERLLETAAQVGAADRFVAVLRSRAQRLGALPGDLARPADFAALLAAFAAGVRGDDPATRTWLLGLAATAPADDELVAAAIAGRWGGDALARARLPAVSIEDLLVTSAVATAGIAPLPQPRPAFVARALADGEVLRARLRDLDRQLAGDDDAPAALAAAGIASLDLGRVELEAGGSSAALLFEDAARLLDRALAAEPDRLEWRLEAARAAYYRQRFAEQHEHAVRALAVAGHDWPPPRDRWRDLLRDADAVEALRWIGDADARLLASVDLDDAGAAVDTMRAALLALGLAAVSPSGRGRDFVGFASLAESLGLVREEVAILVAAQRRLPGDGDVHGAVIGATWRTGRFPLAPALAEAALLPTPTAEARWWAGYTRVLAAEELRRRERPAAAVAHYREAERLFAASAAQNPAYAASVASYVALCRLGRGHAMAQGARAERERAADRLVEAVATGVGLAALRDGIGYDAVDLVDKVLEWRAGGPSPVAPVALLDAIEAAGGGADGVAFWAAAISDSALREALRADGRNPERVLTDTVDAGGRPIRMELGLPTALGDRYLAAAVTAGERAAAAAGAGDDERRVLAQALTIRAERELARGRTDGVRASLQRAAAALDVALPPSADVDAGGELAALRARATTLRERLGPARPRQREGR